MAKLEELGPGSRVMGVVPGASVELVAVIPRGAGAAELIYRPADGPIQTRIFTREDAEGLVLAAPEQRPFDAPRDDLRLAAECQRTTLAGLWDPMLA